MVDEQPRYTHGPLTQHASVYRKRAKSSWVVGESSWTTEGSFGRGHVSSTHDEAPVTPFHALDDVVHVHDPHHAVGHVAATPSDFSRGPYDMSLLPFYAHNTDKYDWEGEIA